MNTNFFNVLLTIADGQHNIRLAELEEYVELNKFDAIADMLGLDLETILKIFTSFKQAQGQLNEGLTKIKRQWTEAYPAVFVNKDASMRNKIVEFIGENGCTYEEFRDFCKNMSEDAEIGKSPNPAWLSQNKKIVKVVEVGNKKYVRLTELGKRVLEMLNNKEINESKHSEKLLSSALKLKDFFRSTAKIQDIADELKKLKYDDKLKPVSDVSKLTKLLNSTSDEGTKLYIAAAFRSNSMQLGDINESKEFTKDYMNYCKDLTKFLTKNKFSVDVINCESDDFSGNGNGNFIINDDKEYEYNIEIKNNNDDTIDATIDIFVDDDTKQLKLKKIDATIFQDKFNDFVLRFIKDSNENLNEGKNDGKEEETELLLTKMEQNGIVAMNNITNQKNLKERKDDGSVINTSENFKELKSTLQKLRKDRSGGYFKEFSTYGDNDHRGNFRFHDNFIETGGMLYTGSGNPKSYIDRLNKDLLNGLGYQMVDDGNRVVKIQKLDSNEKFNEGKNDGIYLPNSNLLLLGSGMDTNGNKVVKLKFPSTNGFSIQVNNTVTRETQYLLDRFSAKQLSDSQLEIIEREVVKYIKNYGSALQKSTLKTYKGFNENKILKNSFNFSQLQKGDIIKLKSEAGSGVPMEIMSVGSDSALIKNTKVGNTLEIKSLKDYEPVNVKNLNESTKPLNYSDLSKGKIYTWTMGAELLDIEYIGLTKDNKDKKAGAKVGGGGFLFKFVKDKNAYLDLGNSAIRKYVVDENLNESRILPELNLSKGDKVAYIMGVYADRDKTTKKPNYYGIVKDVKKMAANEYEVIVDTYDAKTDKLVDKNGMIAFDYVIRFDGKKLNEASTEKQNPFIKESVNEKYQKPFTSKLSDSEFDKLVGLSSNHSIDDLEAKGYKIGDINAAMAASRKAKGQKLAVDGDRKGDDPSHKQYYDRTVKN